VSLTTTVQRGFLRLHEGIYRGTGGRIGHRLLGVPCLLLHTTGARTGQPRTSALVYLADGADCVVVASNGGEDRAPGWLHNVRAHPEVELQIGPRRLAARAREITPADTDYARLWRGVNDLNHDRYDGYQARTARPISLVVLTPT
jgi:deazaflavin-dependent oxidoreductase (nitroreductase family)